MKPQERLLNYALLTSANCAPSGMTTAAASLGGGGGVAKSGEALMSTKCDGPIDLSVRNKQAVVLEAHHQLELLKTFDTAAAAAAVVQHQKLQLQQHHHHPQFRGQHSPPSEWIATKYGLPANLSLPITKPFGQQQQHHPQHYPSQSLLPYLFINPNCFGELEAKKAREELIYEHCATNLRGYSRLPPGGEGVLYPYALYTRQQEAAAFAATLLPGSRHQQQQQHQHQLMHESSTSDGEKLPPSTGSSSACSTSSSSPSNNVEYHYYPECIPEAISGRKSAPHNVIESSKVNSNTITTSNGSHRSPSILSSSSTTPQPIGKSKRSHSLSSLVTAEKADQPALLKSRRTNSENNLHLITNFASPACTPPSPAKLSAPKKMFVSNYYQNKFKEEIRENLLSAAAAGERVETTTKDIEPLNDNEKGTKRLNEDNNNKSTKSYRNYRKEAIESWGMENKQKGSNDENALDLRTNTMAGNFKENCDTLNDLNNLQNIEHYAKAKEVITTTTTTTANSPSPLHVDLYRQYYYYLLQDPAFTSKAAMSAVAEAYAKIMSSTMPPGVGVENFATPPSGDSSPLSDKHPNMYVDSKRVSPDFILSGSKAVELCSADTTITFDRKRISRPLTGKHVRHGTGASPATLVSLRNMIEQRQKFRESGHFELNGRYGKANKANNKRVKRK